MSEIEKAIKLISKGEIDYSGTYNGEINEQVSKVILVALREKAERDDEWRGGKGGKGMTIHKLKLDSTYYDDSAAGIKTFEIRKNDRDFKVGDILELREYVWSNLEKRGAYTGAVHWKIITYIMDDEEYLHDGYVCLAVSPIAEPQS